MDAAAWIVIALLVVLVIVLGVLLVARRRRRERLRERFGPEYDRAVAEADSRRAAENRLTEVAQRRDALEIRPLDPTSADRYRQRWETVQARFVDEPSQAVADADDLIGEVMRERGYPVDDADDSVALVSADHPDVVQRYRTARSLRTREDGADGTEDLRLALVHYRALFTALVEDSRPTGESREPKHREGAEAGGREDEEARP